MPCVVPQVPEAALVLNAIRHTMLPAMVPSERREAEAALKATFGDAVPLVGPVGNDHRLDRRARLLLIHGGHAVSDSGRRRPDGPEAETVRGSRYSRR